MIVRAEYPIDGRVRLELSGPQQDVRAAVDAFFHQYDPWAWNARMVRAEYQIEDGKWFTTVLLVRDVSVNPKYRRDYE